ncbi:type VI secretion system lipoprotein TssJ [Morganella psychrotolerans]|uniref:type VI secretion system lipoprotein TssJ n=1 Tax=Morganella psychrotolerans TaxID=368603 RepID=UPI0039AFFA89
MSFNTVMKHTDFKVANILCVLVISLLLTGCSILNFARSTPSEAKSASELKITLVASAEINKSKNRLPSPLNIFVYAVKSKQSFLSTDYLTYLYKNKPNPENEMLILEYIIRPGETKVIDYKINSDYPYIGIISAYKDISNAKWSTVYSLDNLRGATWTEKYILFTEPEHEIKVLFSNSVVSIKENG